jgi:SSS family solute:Na+ symporter
MTIAPFIANAPQGLFGYLQEVNGCYSIPILTIILVGIFTRNVPPLAAKIGLASGVGLYIISQFGLKYLVGAESYPHFLHVMAALFVLNVCIMLLIGKARPMEQAFVPRDSLAVDMTPWPLAKPVGAVIVLIVVSTYFIFT